MVQFHTLCKGDNHLKKIGQIIQLFISETTSKTRVEKEEISLDGKGIQEDKYYNKNIERSILITSLESYTLAEKHNITMPYASLGENLLIDYNPYHLNAGTKLHIGSVELEISQNCTLCDHLSSIDKQLPSLLKHDRGIFAKVNKEGHIKKGDDIYIVE
jgi:MOSC domain-containing protein YiiM